MLHAYRFHDGQLVKLDVGAQPDQVLAAQWFDLVAATAEEYAFITRATGLALPDADDIVEIENSSRLVVNGDVLTVSMPVLSRQPDGISASACAFVLSPTRLVTLRLAPSIVFDQFVAASHAAGEIAAASLFVALLEAFVDRQADALERLRHELDALSHEVFHHRFAGNKAENNIRGRNTEAALQQVLITIGRDYDTITFLRDSQLGVARIAGFAQGAISWLPAPIMHRLQSLEKDVASLNEFATHLTDKVQFLLDTTLGLINVAQNSLIKLLTIVSIVGIPPTLIAGIYGMNFKNIPELSWDFGYQYAWAIMILSAVLPLLWFRKKGWV
jgi:magnesium transporter